MSLNNGNRIFSSKFAMSLQFVVLKVYKLSTRWLFASASEIDTHTHTLKMDKAKPTSVKWSDVLLLSGFGSVSKGKCAEER